jgi:hypothetical protein
LEPGHGWRAGVSAINIADPNALNPAVNASTSRPLMFNG